MLTVAFVFFALQLLAAASPSPPRRVIRRIGLTPRQVQNSTATADVDLFEKLIGNSLAKYQDAFAWYFANVGELHPLDTVTNTTKRAVRMNNLIDDDGGLWIGTMEAGTPPQTFNVGFDTGSASLLLVSSACSSPGCQSHALYNSASSSTSVNRNRPFRLRVTDTDTVSGNQYSDTASVAGLLATGQVLGASNTYPSSFNTHSIPPDGRLGMGYQAISAYNSPSFPQTLVSQGATTDPVFAFRLGNVNPELTLGGTNPAAFVGTVSYTPVTTKGFWQVNMDSVLLNGQRISGRYPAIIDTGSRLIIGDRGNVKRLYDAIPNSRPFRNGFYTIPCNAVPTVSLTFGGSSYPIDPTLFNLGPVAVGSNQCVGGLVAGTPPQRFWSIGDIFLRNVYSVFDLGGGRVGFATLR